MEQEVRQYYSIGRHGIELVFAFAEQKKPDSLILSLRVDDQFRWEKAGREIGQFDCGGCLYGVYKTEEGGYQYIVRDEQGQVCALMQSDPLFRHNKVALTGQTWTQRNYGLSNSLMLAYAFASADKDTLLMHASVIRCRGKGYLMTAPSGTGKSTHTKLWYDHILGCDLMNDDNPVVRVIDHEAIVFGSPWSGKTPCYRRIEAPVGAIVRLYQKPENSIRRMEVMEAFTQMLPAVSNMKWDKRVYGSICTTLGKLIETCSMWTLGCLPNADAARLCHDTVCPEG